MRIFLTGTGTAVSSNSFGAKDVGAYSPDFSVFIGSLAEAGCFSADFSLGEGCIVFSGDGWVKSSSVVGCCGWVDGPAEESTPNEPENPKFKPYPLNPFENNLSRIISTFLSTCSIL